MVSDVAHATAGGASAPAEVYAAEDEESGPGVKECCAVNVCRSYAPDCSGCDCVGVVRTQPVCVWSPDGVN